MVSQNGSTVYQLEALPTDNMPKPQFTKKFEFIIEVYNWLLGFSAAKK